MEKELRFCCYRKLLIFERCFMPKDMFFPKDSIRNCLADEQTINKAKRYGKKNIVDTREAKLTIYQWKGITYVVDIDVF